MIIRQIKVGLIENFCYLLGDEVTKECAVIDPPANSQRIMEEVGKLGCGVKYIINTHGHADHTGGNEALKAATGAQVVAHAYCRVAPDRPVDDGDVVMLGAIELKFIHTPGHTPDGVCILAGGKALFTGDTLFVGECGRTDLPGSSAEALWHSFFEKLAALPDDVMVLPGHDYGKEPFSTLGEERKTNHTLKPRTLEEFVKFMAE
jgi:glyoxylase-like metal-dependent hydrolase (beta-lactamase superfamily II)